MAEKIKAESRTEFGKGAARRIRREDKVPAVLYGHGNDPIHITLPGHDTMLALKHGGSNALLDIDLDGKTQLALTKQVQLDPIKGLLEHVDFVAVQQGREGHRRHRVHLVGDAAPDTLVVDRDSTRISVEAEATHIPEYIEVSIEGAPVGTQIHARDLTLPEGSRCSPTARSLSSTSPTRRPRRRSRPSWRRPRPRPASSTTCPRRPRRGRRGRGRRGCRGGEGEKPPRARSRRGRGLVRRRELIVANRATPSER